MSECIAYLDGLKLLWTELLDLSTEECSRGTVFPGEFKEPTQLQPLVPLQIP